jgi:hypothetical protein
MSNQHFYHPQVIYTRLKDVFNDETNKDEEDFSTENYIKPLTLKQALELREKKNKKKKNDNLPAEKKKYINKELVECWIEAIKSSNKLIY